MAGLYFYVDSNIGTNVSAGGTTKQTGTMAAQGAASVYGSIEDSINLGLAGAGDFILAANNHSFDFGASFIGWDIAPKSGVPAQVYSVDTNNIDQYLAGAKEETNSSFANSGFLSCKGLSLDTANNIGITNQNNYAWYEDATFYLTSTNDFVGPSANGSAMYLKNIVIDCAAISNYLTCQSGAFLSWIGGGFTGVTQATIFRNSLSQGGGANVFIQDVDLSNVSDYLISDIGYSQTFDDRIDIHIDKCLLSGTLIDFINEEFSNADQEVLITQSSNNAAAALYQYFFYNIFGTVEDYTATYRNESAQFPDGTKISLECITSARTSRLTPLTFKLPSRFAKLATLSTLEIYLTSDTALTDQDVGLRVVYEDATFGNQFNLIETANVDPLAVGVALDTDAVSTYTAGKTNKYVIQVDTSGDAGANCVPVIYVDIFVPSTTIYFDTFVGVVA